MGYYQVFKETLPVDVEGEPKTKVEVGGNVTAVTINEDEQKYVYKKVKKER